LGLDGITYNQVVLSKNRQILAFKPHC